MVEAVAEVAAEGQALPVPEVGQGVCLAELVAKVTGGLQCRGAAGDSLGPRASRRRSSPRAAVRGMTREYWLARVAWSRQVSRPSRHQAGVSRRRLPAAFRLGDLYRSSHFFAQRVINPPVPDVAFCGANLGRSPKARRPETCTALDRGFRTARRTSGHDIRQTTPSASAYRRPLADNLPNREPVKSKNLQCPTFVA